MTRLHWYSLALVLFLMAAPALFAKPFQQDTGGATENCDEIDPDQPCYADSSGSSWTVCTKPGGCPQCAAEFSSGRTVCYVLQGASGKCSCTAKGRITDKHGVSHPYCLVNGTCAVNR